MTTKEYLGQIRVYDKDIDAMLQEISHLRVKITSISPSSNDAERVKSSMLGDKLSNAVCQLVDLENEVSENINKLVDKKRIITKQIQMMPTEDYRNILFLRYVTCEEFEKISDDTNLSIASVYRQHKAGLTEFQRKYGKLYENR